MDYSSNSSSDISTNTLNEKISNDLDVIERQIKVDIEKNNRNVWKDSQYSVDFLKERQKPIKYVKDSEYEYNAGNNLNFYVERNLLNVQNISDESVNQYQDFDKNFTEIKDIVININNDNLNHSIIGSDNIEIEKIFFNESKLEFKSNKTFSLNEKTINNSLMKTTATVSSSDSRQVSESRVSLKDNYLEIDSKPKTKGNIYKNKVIITVDTTDSSITTNISQRSNSLIDRIKYLNAEEVNKNSTKNQNYLNKFALNKSVSDSEQGAAVSNECVEFVNQIAHHVSGGVLEIRYKQKPENYVEKLCLYLSCASNECNNSADWERLCRSSHQKCTNISDSECELNITNSSNSDCKLKYISVWFVCKLKSQGSVDCRNHLIQFNTEKPGTDNTIVVIITATVVPIIICVVIFSTFVYFKRNRNMKKFDW